jgi:alpha-amylase
MKKFLAIVLLVVYLEACSPARTILPTSNPLTTEPAPIFLPKNASLLPWWTQAVFYEIFVRSFNDSNGDGIGDFNGITQKLDYLKDLGVTAIWLMPIHPSPSYHGYDVINYFAVNMDYGTQDDFKLMLDEAHRRGMRVIIDLVVNHTSNQNPVFIEANNNPQSPYRNWYIWSDTDPGTSGLNGPAWHAGKFGYYYGIFGANMPDLNYTNPEVTTFMEKVARYWLTTVGLDGFRLDAPKYLIEEDKKLENTGSTHAWFRNFYTAYKSDKPDAFTVGEIYGAGAFLAKTYTGDQFDQVFNFEMASGFVNSAAGEANSGVNSAIKFMLKDLPDGQFATFLTNHDQNRVMSTLNGNLGQARVAAALMFTAPGTPFIYYGEEIGMQGKKPDEDIRLPMQWSAQTNAGFTNGTPWRTPASDYPQVNVASESSNPDSLLSFYKELIALRHAHSALWDGKTSLVANGNPGVYSILRSDRDEEILVLINLTKAAISNYDLSLQNAGLADGQHSLGVLYGNGAPAPLTIASQGFSSYKPLEELPAYSVSIFKIKP